MDHEATIHQLQSDKETLFQKSANLSLDRSEKIAKSNKDVEQHMQHLKKAEERFEKQKLAIHKAEEELQTKKLSVRFIASVKH